VTVRFRDSMEQKRIPIDELTDLIDKEVNMKYLLQEL